MALLSAAVIVSCRVWRDDIPLFLRFYVYELSFIRSFAKGSWISSIYTPPITAEFLRRVSLRVTHGEVHGIIGASGCGKSTLLKVVAHQIEGKIDGQVLLNGQTLTKDRFSQLCEYVDLNAQLLDKLTVEQSLQYHARLSLNCKQDAVNYRVFTLMQQFDLGPVANQTVSELNEADRRRLLIAMHLVKDPVLIVIDDPLIGLDALSAFQLMSSLQDYTKRQARMALVSMRCPRSDIYQLLSQISLLFYGEVVYSGPTKQMPHYFSQLGFRCPPTENPAVYYLSLATIDRETPESYAETQTKAIKLAEVFRERRNSLPYLSNFEMPNTEMPILGCYYGSPSTWTKLVSLFGRHMTHISRSGGFAAAQLILPFVLILTAVFGSSMTSTSWHSPKSMAGTLFVTYLATGLAAVWTTVVQFAPLRPVVFLDVSLGLYNAVLILAVYLGLGFVLDLLSLGLGAFAIVWRVTDDIQLEPFVHIFTSILFVYYAYKLLTLACSLCMDSSHRVLLTMSTICVGMNVVASGFLKSYHSFVSASSYLLPATTIMLERIVNVRAAVDFVNVTHVQNCSRNEFQEFASPSAFCRWTSGSDYLEESVPDAIATTSSEWWIGLVLVLGINFITIVFFLLVTQKCAQKKVAKLYKS